MKVHYAIAPAAGGSVVLGCIRLWIDGVELKGISDVVEYDGAVTIKFAPPSASDITSEVLDRVEDAKGPPHARPDWTPSAENINALPDPIRRYVHDLATRCDPAGELLELYELRTQVRDINTMLAGLRAERDEADRRAGAAERRLACEEDTNRKRRQWNDEQKRARGYSTNDTFDKVWHDVCALADGKAPKLRRLLAFIRTLHRYNAWSMLPERDRQDWADLIGFAGRTS